MLYLNELIELKKIKCFKCGYEWWPRPASIPKVCSKCKTKNWSGNYVGGLAGRPSLVPDAVAALAVSSETVIRWNEQVNKAIMRYAAKTGKEFLMNGTVGEYHVYRRK